MLGVGARGTLHSGQTNPPLARPHSVQQRRGSSDSATSDIAKSVGPLLDIAEPHTPLRPEEPHKFANLATQLLRWDGHISTRHRASMSNGSTAAIDNPIKRVRWVAFGLGRLANYRMPGLRYARRRNRHLPTASVLR